MPITAPSASISGPPAKPRGIWRSRLDVAIERAAPRRADLGAEHADRAQRGARGAAGAADREREVADREAVELAKRGGRQAAAADAQQRDVGAGIAADDLGVALVERAVGAADADAWCGRECGSWR